MTIMARHRGVSLVASPLVMLASVAGLLSACAQQASTLPQISTAQVDSGSPLPEGVLPNGLMFQPYAD